MRLHQLRLQEWERVSSVVQLNLIGWWLQEEEAQWMREILTSTLMPLADDLAAVREPAEGAGEPEAEAGILSSWTLAHLSQRRIQECQSALQRYVRSHQRKRGHRETEQRALVQRRCPPPAEAGGA